MKYEPKEPEIKKVWIQCEDYSPWTFREKLAIIFSSSKTFIGSVVLLISGQPIFYNCKHVHDCNSIRPIQHITFLGNNNTVYNDCKAGEWK